MNKYTLLDSNTLYPLIFEDVFMKLINKVDSCGKYIVIFKDSNNNNFDILIKFLSLSLFCIIVFTTGGVQQFVLDIHFFLQVCEKFINDSINQLANKLCEYALRSYYLAITNEKENNPEASTDVSLKVFFIIYIQ